MEDVLSVTDKGVHSIAVSSELKDKRLSKSRKVYKQYLLILVHDIVCMIVQYFLHSLLKSL